MPTNSEILAIPSPVPSYEIPVKEFIQRPRRVQSYDLRFPPNRTTFTSFLIKGFAVSGGHPDIHYAYCEWSHVNYGFNYQTTFNNFYEAGGLDSLSRRESYKVKKSYLGIPEHSAWNISNEDLNVFIRSQLLGSLTTANWQLLIKPDQLAGMTPETLSSVLVEERVRRGYGRSFRRQMNNLIESEDIHQIESDLVMKDLSLFPPEITDEEREQQEWRRGTIYFHSLQDLMFAAEALNDDYPDRLKDVRQSQSCYIHDLSAYLARFPEDQPVTEIYFKRLLGAGYAALWDQKPNFAQELFKLYRELDDKVIRPWVKAE